MSDDRDDDALKAPDRPTTVTSDQANAHFATVAREEVEKLLEDDEDKRRAALDVDRYYRCCVADWVDWDQQDAIDAIANRAEWREYWTADEEEDANALRGFLYRGGRPDYFDHGDLSSLEFQVTALERRAIRRWRDDGAPMPDVFDDHDGDGDGELDRR